MATTFDAPRGAIDIGHVIQTLFAVIGRNFATFFVLALILAGLPAAVIGVLSDPTVRLPGPVTFNAWTAYGGILAVITTMVLQGTLVYGAINDLNGKRPSVGEALAVGLRAFLPLIAIAIMTTLALIVGFALVVVPGFILMVIWSVVVPAYIAEGRGVFESYSRSAALTEGNRWRIFALILLYGVAAWVFSGLVNALSGALMLVPGDAGRLIAAVVITPLRSAFTAMVAATGVAVLYVELRRAREGLGVDALAAFFD